MSKCNEWIEDLLSTVKMSNDPQSTALVRCCGKGCAQRKNAVIHMEALRASAAECKTRQDYAAFLKDAMPVRIEEANDGIVMHLEKKCCSCPIAAELSTNADMLCECTRGHEIAAWSAFFGKPVNVEIVESILRGGKDCVIKILF